MNTTANKHSPGPWNEHDGTIYSREGRRIAETAWPENGTSDEVQGNAALIAAAPDMLEALKSAKAHMDYIANETKRNWRQSDQTIYELISAAIAKAEGRSA